MVREHSISVPTRLLHTPLLISTCEAELIGAVLRGTIQPEHLAGAFKQEGQRSYYVADGVAILPIIGGINYRGYGWYWQVSYNQIRLDFRAALADPEVKAIAFDIDSPGGEVAGCFDLVDEIYNARGSKPIYAVANEICLSAAYALGSAAEKLFISRTGSVGSVGVIAIHVEQSKFDEQIGVKWTAIFAGNRKNDFSTHEPLSKEALSVAQDRVDSIHDLFCRTVARNRGLTTAAVRGTEAAIYKGGEAVSAGMANEVAGFEQAISIIQSRTRSKGRTTMKPEDVRTGLATMIGDPQTKAQAHELLKSFGFVPRDQGDMNLAFAKSLEKGREQGVKEGTERALAIAEACMLAGTENFCAQLIRDGVCLENARTRITEAKAAQSARLQVNSATTPMGSGYVSPLVQDARRRASAAESDQAAAPSGNGSASRLVDDARHRSSAAGDDQGV